MTDILKGRPVADAITNEMKEMISALADRGIVPKIAIVRLGERSDDLAYERGVVKKCSSVGVDVVLKTLPENASCDETVDVIRSLGADSSINGILPFRPMPGQIDITRVKEAIDPIKDIDCLSPFSMASIYDRSLDGNLPCTASAVVEILKYYKIPMTGKDAVILGRSQVVGRALSLLLLDEDCTVTVCHSKTSDLIKTASRADILVAAIGRARFVKAEHLKKGAVLIDVGINDDGNGGICGDADADSISGAELSAFTPVPGGVGSVTTAILVRSAVRACMKMNGIARSS